MLESIFQFFTLFKHLGIRDLLKLKQISTQNSYKRGEQIAAAGDRFPYIIAIRKGLIRTYELNSSGEERTTRLAKEGDFTSCRTSFLLEQPSQEYLEALEDCKVILINISEFNKLAKQHHQFLGLYSEGLTDAFLEATDRIRFFTLLTPEERYAEMLEQTPELVQRVPQKYLASFIGITTVSLSRIRKRLSDS